jgi:tetratricopeptide (TPR) repeat protein
MRKVRLVHIIMAVVVGWGLPTYAQSASSDQVEEALDSALSNINRDSKKALEFCQQAKTISRQHQFDSLLIRSLLVESKIHQSVGNATNCLDVLKETEALPELSQYPSMQCECWHKMAMCLSKLGDFVSMTEYAHLSMDLADELGDATRKAWVLNLLGDVSRTRDKLLESIDYLSQARSIFEQIPDTIGILATSNNLALAYDKQGDTNRALDLFYGMLEYQHLLGPNHEARVYNNLGRIYSKIGEVNTSEEFLFKSLEIRRTLDAPFGLAHTLNEIGTLYLDQDRITEALPYFEESIALAASIDVATLHMDLHRNMSELHEKAGNWKEALDHRKSFQDYQEIVFDQEKTDEIQVLERKYEKEKHLAELEAMATDQQMLKQEGELLKAKSALLIVVVIVVVILLIVIGVRWRQSLHHHRTRFDKQQETAKNELNKVLSRKQELEKDLDLKNQELLAFALNRIDKNEKMRQLREKLQNYEGKRDDGSELHQLKLAIDKVIDIDKDWDDFHYMFSQVHKDFLSGLKQHYSSLTNGELRICAMIKVHLSTSEISSLLGISDKSVTMARYRIHKKMILPKGIRLQDHLIAFAHSSQPDAHLRLAK